jgi:hypothetical protein
MKVHPNSGAGHIKHDGSDDEFLVEVKDARKSYTMKSTELRELTTRAIRQSKLPMFLVYFIDGDFTLECHVIPGGKELIA